jgi:hypothetical protein
MYQQPPAQPMYQQPPQQYGERVVSVVPTLKKMKFLGQWDTYALMITDKRSIFCFITGEMVKQGIKEAQEAAKAKGEGFWGQWAAQLDTSFFYTQRYKQMTPEQAIREQPNNFAIDHGSMRKVVLWRKNHPNQKGQILKTVFWEVEFESNRGKEKYTIDMIDPEQELAAGYGSKLHT